MSSPPPSGKHKSRDKSSSGASTLNKNISNDFEATRSKLTLLTATGPTKSTGKDRLAVPGSSATTSKSAIASTSSKTTAGAPGTYDTTVVSRPAPVSSSNSNLSLKTGRSTSPAPVIAASAKSTIGGTFAERTSMVASSSTHSTTPSIIKAKIKADLPKNKPLKRKEAIRDFHDPPRKASTVELSRELLLKKLRRDLSSAKSSKSSDDLKFKVAKSTTSGGFGTFATKEFKPGDLIMQEKPVIFIPDKDVRRYEEISGEEPEQGDSTRRKDMILVLHEAFQKLSREKKEGVLKLEHSVSDSDHAWYIYIAEEMAPNGSKEYQAGLAWLAEAWFTAVNWAKRALDYGVTVYGAEHTMVTELEGEHRRLVESQKSFEGRKV